MKKSYQIQIFYKDHHQLPDGTLTKRIIEDELSLVELLNKYVLLEPITIDNYKNYQCPDEIKNDDLIKEVVLLKTYQKERPKTYRPTGSPDPDYWSIKQEYLFWKCQGINKDIYIDDIIKQEMELITNN